MNSLTSTIRIVLGITIFVIGLSKFIFMDLPIEDNARIFFHHLATYGGGYIIIFISVIEMLLGILFIWGKFIPLAAVLFFPIALNAFLFHAFLDPVSISAATFVLIADIVLLVIHKKDFAALLKAHSD